MKRLLPFVIEEKRLDDNTCIIQPEDKRNKLPLFDRIDIAPDGETYAEMNADAKDPLTGRGNGAIYLGRYKGMEYVSNDDRRIVLQPKK